METVGLELLSCKRGCRAGAGSAGKRGDWGHPTAAVVWTGGDGGDAAGLFTGMHGGRVRGSSTAETAEIQSASKEETFSPTKDSPAVERGPRQLVPSPALDVIKSQVDKVLSSLV